MSQIGGVADKGRITQEMWSFFSVSHDRIDVSDLCVHSHSVCQVFSILCS